MSDRRESNGANWFSQLEPWFERLFREVARIKEPLWLRSYLQVKEGFKVVPKRNGKIRISKPLVT